MRHLFKTSAAAVALAMASFGAIQPAQARDNTGVAIAAGIIGLGVGAAIASDHPHAYPAGYYDRGPTYGYGYSYAPPPPPPVYYGGYGYRDRWERHDHWERDHRDRDWDRGYDRDHRWR